MTERGRQQLDGPRVVTIPAEDPGHRGGGNAGGNGQIPRQPALRRKVGFEFGDVEPGGCFHLFPDNTPVGNTCQHHLLPTVTGAAARPLHSARMAAKAQRALVFGQLLRLLRDDTFKKRTSLRSAEVATASTMHPLTHTAFRNYEEEGRIPGLPQLHAIASAYGVEWQHLAAALLEDLQRDDATVEQLLAIAKPAESQRREPDLVELGTPDGATEFIPLPILANRIAAGHPLTVDPHDVVGYGAFSPRLLTRLGVKAADAVLVRVGWAQRSMSPTIKPDDIVLLDCSEATRTNPQNGDIYAVNIDEGSALKRVVIVGNLMSLVSDNLDKAEYPILPPMDITDRFIQGLIVGKAVWWGNALL